MELIDTFYKPQAYDAYRFVLDEQAANMVPKASTKSR